MRNILASSSAPHAALTALAAKPDSIGPKTATSTDSPAHQKSPDDDSEAAGFRSILGAKMPRSGGRKSLFRC